MSWSHPNIQGTFMNQQVLKTVNGNKNTSILNFHPFLPTTQASVEFLKNSKTLKFI